MSALEIADSAAWRAGALHERERIIRLLEQRRDALESLPRLHNWDARRKAIVLAELQRAITAIREAG